MLAASVSGANLATELCCQQQVYLILMDVQTENRENGLTAAAQIKREHPQIKMPDWAKIWNPRRVTRGVSQGTTRCTR